MIEFDEAQEQEKKKNKEVLFMDGVITTKQEQELIQSIQRAKDEIDTVYNNFQYATDPYMIDSYIYELKALQMKYEYLLKCAKQLRM